MQRRQPDWEAFDQAGIALYWSPSGGLPLAFWKQPIALNLQGSGSYLVGISRMALMRVTGSGLFSTFQSPPCLLRSRAIRSRSVCLSRQPSAYGLAITGERDK